MVPADLLVNGLNISLAPLWTFFLILTRLIALLLLLPGVGSEQIPAQFRFYLAFTIAIITSMSIPQLEMPGDFDQMVLIVSTEFLYGLVLALIPSIVLGGLAVSGQVVAGVIGLGQANMIDRSLGENVSVIARFNMLIGTIIFLAIEGHHILIKAATIGLGSMHTGNFTSMAKGSEILMHAFSSSFELAIVISSPILIATLITQFLLGLITKFVKQVNIFIISLPLSIFMGFYIMSYTTGPFNQIIIKEFKMLEELASAVLIK